MRREAPFDQDGTSRPNQGPERPGAPFGLRAIVSVLGVLVLVGLVGLVLEHVQPGLFAGLRSGGTTTLPRSLSTSSTTSTTLPAGGGSSGGASPVIASVRPASGTSGESVTLTGTGFFSSDGNVSVTFGAAPAGVHCPTESRCLVTVPAGKPGSTASVRMTTQSGQSNTVTFHYR